MKINLLRNSMLRRNLLLVIKITLFAAVLGIAVSSWQNYTARGFIGWRNVLNGFVDAFLIVGLLTTYKLIFSDILFSRFFAKLSFARTLILNSVIYSILILFGRAVGRYIMEYDRFILFPVGDEVARAHFFQALGIALFFSLLLNFLLQNSRLLGPKVLANFITGRYHNPIQEERIVLFMDLKSSTTITEKLGNQAYVAFLSDAFADLTEAIIETEAEIYKYVGDEIILTWSVELGLKNNNCIRFPLLVNAFFVTHSEKYQKQYGHVPQFRTGIHVGELVIGEIGVLKREIALIGDVMNTTARIAAYCRDCGKNLLISGSLFSALEMSQDFAATALGAVPLRGKTEDIELFAVSATSQQG